MGLLSVVFLLLSEIERERVGWVAIVPVFRSHISYLRLQSESLFYFYTLLISYVLWCKLLRIRTKCHQMSHSYRGGVYVLLNVIRTNIWDSSIT